MSLSVTFENALETLQPFSRKIVKVLSSALDETTLHKNTKKIMNLINSKISHHQLTKKIQIKQPI